MWTKLLKTIVRGYFLDVKDTDNFALISSCYNTMNKIISLPPSQIYAMYLYVYFLHVLQIIKSANVEQKKKIKIFFLQQFFFVQQI